jgi:hypothetical protein
VSDPAYGVRVAYGALPKAIIRDTDRPEIVRQAQSEAIGAALPYLQRRLALATPEGATGKARQLVVVERSMLGDEPVGAVGWAEPASGYIAFANDGTRPHWPPRAPMEFYAARKFGYPVGSKEAKRAGYLLARRISRYGTKAQHFFEGVVESSRDQAEALMARAALDVFHRWGGA